MTLDGIVGEGLGLMLGQMFFSLLGRIYKSLLRSVAVLVPASYYFGRTLSRMYV
jgi:hypothetical protein